MIINDVNSIMRWETNPYTEVNYIATTGSAKFNTPYIPNNNSLVKYYYTVTWTASSQILVDTTTAGNTGIRIQRNTTTSSLRGYAGGVQGICTNGTGTPYLIAVDKPGNKVYTNSSSTGASFGSVSSNSGIMYFYIIGGRGYKFEASEGGVIKCEMKPVIRNSDSALGFLETVTNTFYQQTTSATLTYG